jgi:hypothetical protein
VGGVGALALELLAAPLALSRPENRP